ncbi:glycosyltransferase family 1 protein [Kordiimonas sp. SCSIO 12610]|nr:glycosyltransferase family 1 protein [Kordiimonas sp. SCSIO 12610]
MPVKKQHRICIVSDAWHPQVNGVVRTLDTLRKTLRRPGHRVFMLTPKMFKTIPCPTYSEIRLSMTSPRVIGKILKRWNIDALHIATEGPLGWMARNWCIKNKYAFTTAYHTAFPEYIEARTPIKADYLYPVFRRFHAASSAILVATPTVQRQLENKGFQNIKSWTRGVDTNQFYPRVNKSWDFKSPVELYVGRVAVEKNIEAFLDIPTEGTKVVVGNGPALEELQKKYPDVKFMGALFGSELADAYSSADVFVFPSKTDTFGLVMIEALASGTPVAAYPVQGPVDVLGPDGTGPFPEWHVRIAALDEDLSIAIAKASECDPINCHTFARKYDWNAVAEQFLSALKFQELEPQHEPEMLPTKVPAE